MISPPPKCAGPLSTKSQSTVEECIVIDVSGDFAHFRKPATTSPAQTFGLPPRTTIAGMIAGMLGLGRDSYYDLFSREHSRVAVSLENSTRRLSIPINILTTTGSKRSSKGGRVGTHISEPRQQTVFEVLSMPAYRLYISLDNKEIMDQMEEKFAAGKSTYTLTLGLSEHLASFEYVGRFQIEEKAGQAKIRSAVPGQQVDLVPTSNASYVTERSPAFMRRRSQDGRVADGSQTLTYERNGQSVKVRNTEYSVVGDDAVVFS